MSYHPHGEPFRQDRKTSVALVIHRGAPQATPACLSSRSVLTPDEVGPNDGVLLFRGAGMAPLVHRFATGMGAGLPPVAVPALLLDRADVRSALGSGAASRLLESEQPDLLEAALRCTAAGRAVLAADISVVRHRLAHRAAARRSDEPAAVTRRLLLPTDMTARTATVPGHQPCLSRREGQLMGLLSSGRGIRRCSPYGGDGPDGRELPEPHLHEAGGLLGVGPTGLGRSCRRRVT
ncbi:hypothetical protein [Streptomyces sp. T028]|uniref:hypothetical protein n=1 Tax=Streptomyces sp. T028 TaxID=3394379 RepID=UPI003A85449D